MRLSNGLLFAVVALVRPSWSAPELYGLTRVPNSETCSGAPSGCSQLVSVDAASGTVADLEPRWAPRWPKGHLGAHVGAGREPLIVNIYIHKLPIHRMHAAG